MLNNLLHKFYSLGSMMFRRSRFAPAVLPPGRFTAGTFHRRWLAVAVSAPGFRRRSFVVNSSLLKLLLLSKILYEPKFTRK